MEFTISQIGSASPHWVARHMPASGNATRASGTPQSADTVPPTPVARLGELETEYDQFGRFGVTAGNAADIAEAATSHRPAINATKHFRAGHVTASQLDQEYARSLLDNSIGTEGETGARRFIPAFMTEYQVYQLHDFQYRWAIEVERRILVRMEEMERRQPAVSEVAFVDGSRPSTDLPR